MAVNTMDGKMTVNSVGENGRGNVSDSNAGGGNVREMEGERDMEGIGMDGGGRGGSKKGENLTRRESISRREPLRGGRRKKGSISKEEKEMMAHYMKRWLGVAPPKSKQS